MPTEPQPQKKTSSKLHMLNRIKTTLSALYSGFNWLLVVLYVSLALLALIATFEDVIHKTPHPIIYFFLVLFIYMAATTIVALLKKESK